MNDMNLLSRWEEVYLLSILELKDNAYGVSIRKKLSEKARKELSYGSLYFSLGQLVKKGFVTKKTGEPTSKRGGRRKYYYTLTDDGIKALQATYEHQQSLWKGKSAPISD